MKHRKSMEAALLIKGARESVKPLIDDDVFAGGIMEDVEKRGVMGGARYIILCDALLRERKRQQQLFTESIQKRPWWKRLFGGTK